MLAGSGGKDSRSSEVTSDAKDFCDEFADGGREEFLCFARSPVAIGEACGRAAWFPERAADEPVGLSLSLSLDDVILLLKVPRNDLDEPCVSVLTIGTVSLKDAVD